MGSKNQAADDTMYGIVSSQTAMKVMIRRMTPAVPMRMAFSQGRRQLVGCHGDDDGIVAAEEDVQ